MTLSSHGKLKCQSSGEAKLIFLCLPPSTALHGAGAMVIYRSWQEEREQKSKTHVVHEHKAGNERTPEYKAHADLTQSFSGPAVVALLEAFFGGGPECC